MKVDHLPYPQAMSIYAAVKKNQDGTTTVGGAKKVEGFPLSE
jgi:hypothetical protein